MRRNIFIIIGLVIMIGAATGIYLWNKPHQNIQKATADLTVEAPALMADFNTDETTANARYLDKVVSVTGKVQTVNSGNGSTLISLEANDDLGVISCELDPAVQHPRTNFSPGEQLTLKGVCAGKMMDVVLTRCVIVE